MIKLKVATSEKVIYEKEVMQVSLPTVGGEITILQNHVPLVTILSPGEMKIKDNGGENIMAIAGGYVEIKPNSEVIILADNAEYAQQIDVDRAEQARLRAEEEMKQAKNRQDVDFAKLQAIIDREMNRIKIGKKYKNIRQRPS